MVLDVLQSIDLHTWSIIIFILIVVLLIYKDRKNFKRESILLFRKTDGPPKFAVNLGKNHPTFWKYMGNLAIVIVFAVSVFAFYLLIANLYVIWTTEAALPGLAAVVPTTSTSASFGPGYFAIPFWYWVIPIVLLLIVHEGFHAIMAGREKIRVKSWGIGVLAVLPLAFVEIDEKQMAKKPKMSQLRVLAAGSYANFLFAGGTYLILIFAFSGLIMSGVAFSGYSEGYPAEVAGLEGIITSIDGYQINNIQDLNFALTQAGIGKKITIETIVINEDRSREVKQFTLVTAAPPEGSGDMNKGYLGIAFGPTGGSVNLVKQEFLAFESVIIFLQGLLAFNILINVGVGIFNTLPITILDGGRMWQLAIKYISPKNEKRIFKGLQYFAILVIILNFTLPYIKSLVV